MQLCNLSTHFSYHLIFIIIFSFKNQNLFRTYHLSKKNIATFHQINMYSIFLLDKIRTGETNSLEISQTGAFPEQAIFAFFKCFLYDRVYLSIIVCEVLTLTSQTRFNEIIIFPFSFLRCTSAFSCIVHVYSRRISPTIDA